MAAANEEARDKGQLRLRRGADDLDPVKSEIYGIF